MEFMRPALECQLVSAEADAVQQKQVLGPWAKCIATSILEQVQKQVSSRTTGIESEKSMYYSRTVLTG